MKHCAKHSMFDAACGHCDEANEAAMTTPKSEAMEKAERIAREIVIEKKDCGERCRICTSFITGWHTKECQIEEIVKAIASTIEPLLSAEKERDELKAKQFNQREIKFLLHCIGVANRQFTMRGGQRDYGQEDMSETCETKLRAFLAKQGEK
jgi:hypothetical protein